MAGMGPFIATLPMYDWPEVRAAVDAEWAAIRDRLRAAGIDAPQALTRPGEDGVSPELGTLWRDPRLLFGQTCWGPLEEGLEPHVTVIAQPDYSAFEGGHGANYSSVVLMRRDAWVDTPVPAPPGGRAILPLDQLAGLRFAYNSTDSMSGFKAMARDLQAAGQSLDIFAAQLPSGGHRFSIRMLATGAADVCTVDCRSWALARDLEPAAGAVVAVGWTARRKGLPYMMANALSPLADTVRRALAQARVSETG